MAAGVPHQPHRPSPAEGEQQRGGAKQAGQKNQTQNPHRHVVFKKKKRKMKIEIVGKLFCILEL